MARPAFTQLDKSLLIIGKYGHDTVFDALRKNSNAVRIATLPWRAVGGGTSAGSWTTMTWTSGLSGNVEIEVYIPTLGADYSGIQKKLGIYGTILLTGGATDGDVRLRDSASGDTGTEINTTNVATLPDFGDFAMLELDLQAGWSGTYRTIQIQGIVNAGAGSVAYRGFWDTETTNDEVGYQNHACYLEY